MLNKNLKEVNKFAIPLIIQFIGSYVIGIIDSSIIARVSIPAFNAVNLIFSTLSTLAGILGCITIVFNINGGKKFGENDKNGLTFEFYTSLLLSTILGTISVIILHFYGKEIFSRIYNISGETLEQAMIYLKTMKYYILLQLLLFSFSTIFKIKNKTKIILVSSTIGTIVNLLMDILFVLGMFGLPKLGIWMAGFSNITSMIVSICIYLFLASEDIKRINVSVKIYYLNIVTHFKESCIFFLQDIIDSSVFVVFINMIIIRIGDVDFAAYSAIGYVVGILIVIKYVYGSAIISIVSVAKGTENKYNINGIINETSIYITIIYCILAIFVFISKDYLILIVNNNIDVLSLASSMIVFFLIANIPSMSTYIYQSGLQAIGKSKFVLYSTAITNLITLVLMIIFVDLFKMGLIGVAVCKFLNELVTYFVYRRMFSKNKTTDIVI